MPCSHEEIDKNILITPGQWDCQQVEIGYVFIFHIVVIDSWIRRLAEEDGGVSLSFPLVDLFLQRQAAQQEHEQWQHDRAHRWCRTMWPSSRLPAWSVHPQNRPISSKTHYTEAWTGFLFHLKVSLYFYFLFSGSCCDLRHHECSPYNRGLNNKCYDDCMCKEGER